MRIPNTRKSIEGIIFDAQYKLTHGENPLHVLAFIQRRATRAMNEWQAYQNVGTTKTKKPRAWKRVVKKYGARKADDKQLAQDQ